MLVLGAYVSSGSENSCSVTSSSRNLLSQYQICRRTEQESRGGHPRDGTFAELDVF
jgi:hypothetical protein